MTPRRLLLCGALILSFSAPAGVVLAEDDPIQNEEIKPAPKAKKKPAKKKTYDYERSKYKSKAENLGATYRFNESGEPITAESKKKKAPAKKKRSEPPEIGSAEDAGSCGLEEACSEKKTEADAL